MKMRRLVLPVQEAKPGMRLSSDVRGPGGAVLLAAGAVLGEDALAGLRRRGIDAVSVDLNLPTEQACCLPDGQCSIQFPGECTFLGGTPAGPGTTCSPDPCGVTPARRSSARY